MDRWLVADRARSGVSASGEPQWRRELYLARTFKTSNEHEADSLQQPGPLAAPGPEAEGASRAGAARSDRPEDRDTRRGLEAHERWAYDDVTGVQASTMTQSVRHARQHDARNL